MSYHLLIFARSFLQVLIVFLLLPMQFPVFENFVPTYAHLTFFFLSSKTRITSKQSLGYKFRYLVPLRHVEEDLWQQGSAFLDLVYGILPPSSFRSIDSSIVPSLEKAGKYATLFRHSVSDNYS